MPYVFSHWGTYCFLKDLSRILDKSRISRIGVDASDPLYVSANALALAVYRTDETDGVILPAIEANWPQ